MSSLLLDLRHSFRLLWYEKAFAATVVLTLAVCVGVNATVFSVVNAVLLAPLPFPDADRLVVVLNSYAGADVPEAPTSPTDYFVRRERVASFQSLAQFQPWTPTVGESGATERIRSLQVTASFFPMLGVEPRLGRGFREEEMAVGNQQVVILTHRYWEEQFGNDPAALESDLRIDGLPYRIVGILPPGFRMPQNAAPELRLAREEPRLFMPIPYSLESRGLDRWHSNNNYYMWARLRSGVSIDEARAENDALNAALVAESTIPNVAELVQNVGYGTLIEPLRDDLVREVRATLYLLWAGAMFVLLIGCVNIAGLILARSQVRLREVATRLAVGAPHPLLVREMLVHALVLALIGGALGVLLSLTGIRLLGALGATDLPRGTGITLDATVLLFTLALAVTAGLIFGAIPSAQLLRTDLRSVLETQTRGGTASRTTVSVRTALVTAQVALAFMLLIGAGLMLASFGNALAVDPGFEQDGVLTGSLPMSGPRYADWRARRQFADALIAEVRSLPGVRAVGITTLLPFSGDRWSTAFVPEGYTAPAGESSLLSPLQATVDGDYFDAMSIPLVEGRMFEPPDGLDGRRVVILDERLARRYFGDTSPIGRRMIYGVPETADEDDYYSVIGVARAIKHNDLTEPATEYAGAFYLPYRQFAGRNISLVISASGDPLSLTGTLRERIARLDPDLPLFDVQTLSDRIDASLTRQRTSILLLSTFAAVALFLAIVGVYGVVAFAVTQRQREIGVRLALGATTRDVFRLVVRHGLRMTGVGLLIGGAGAALMSQFIQSLLFGVQPLDPAVVAVMAAILGAVAVAACVIPAIQATRVDPVRVLAGE